MNINTIKYIRQTITSNKNITYWVKDAGPLKRITHEYFFKLKNKGVKVMFSNTKIKKSQCLGISKKGFQCLRSVLVDNKYCFQHKKKRVQVSTQDSITPLQKVPQLGQYFTTSKILLDSVLLLIRNNPKIILEPCVGRGHLVAHILNKINCQFDMFEIDKSLSFNCLVDPSKIIFTDFLVDKIFKKYETIVANPPYSITGKTNVYLDFINKCFNLLLQEGELIFIVPSNFFRISAAKKLREEMLLQGTFTDVYFFNEENLFKNANVSVLVFRYVKTANADSIVFVNGIKKKLIIKNGYVYFIDLNIIKYNCLSKFFSFHVGLVSGANKIFNNNLFGNIQVLVDKNKVENYICIEEFPTKNPEINKYLLEEKKSLITRQGRVFNEQNWFKWNLLRNWALIKKNFGKPCLYVRTLTRKSQIAFLGSVCYFSGPLIMLLPTKDDLKLSKYVSLLNSKKVRRQVESSGRVSINSEYLSMLPIRTNFRSNSGGRINVFSPEVKISQRTRCLALTKKNCQCSRKALINKKFCFQHLSQGEKPLVVSPSVAREFDQFYTKQDSAKLCMSWYNELVKINRVKDLIIEPSAGTGSFCSFLSGENTLFLDLFPKNSRIMQKNFLTLEVDTTEYNKVHIIGNPPFKRACAFIKKACQIGDFVAFILPRSYKKDSRKRYFPLNFHCVFSRDLPKDSFIFEGSSKDVPTIFQIWKKKSYNRNVPEKLVSPFFDFVKKQENPCLSFQRVGFKPGRLGTDLDKSENTHYFLKLKKNICRDWFLTEYKKIVFEHNNTVGQKSISQQELIAKTNTLTLKIKNVS